MRVGHSDGLWVDVRGVSMVVWSAVMTAATLVVVLAAVMVAKWVDEKVCSSVVYWAASLAYWLVVD